jgi:hypothetical protein
MTLLRGALVLSGVRPLSPIVRAGMRFPTIHLIQTIAGADQCEAMRAQVFIARDRGTIQREGKQI